MSNPYPSFEPPTMKEAAHEIQREKSRRFARHVLMFLGSILLFGMFLGVGIGYSIWG